MKKYQILVIFFVTAAIVLSACSVRQKAPTLKYERRLGKYFNDNNSQQVGNTIDLSDGPRLKYDAKVGPQELNFDVKIKDPYW